MLLASEGCLAAEDALSKERLSLNHLIKELLPPQSDGQRWSNSDPVTGQAAWFDLKVKIVKADPNEPPVAYPQFPALPRMNAVDIEPVKTLRYGLQWTTKDAKAWWRKKS